MINSQALKAGARGFARSTGPLLFRGLLGRLGPERTARLIMRLILWLSPLPAATVAELRQQIKGLIEPTPNEIIANYIEGLVLHGRYDRTQPFEWKKFPSRSIITPQSAKVPHDVRRFQRKGGFEIRFDDDLELIVKKSSENRQSWITPGVVSAVLNLDKAGHAFTVGCYADGLLCGGLWGIKIGGLYGIMSMFHTSSNAGSLALAALIDAMVTAQRGIRVIECGPIKRHFELYGARSVSNEELSRLTISQLSTSDLPEGYG